MTITVHKGDLPDHIEWGDRIGVDSETLGLNLQRDPLCLVQLSSGDGNAHIVQLDRQTYDAPNLKALLGDENVTKIFHFARFDLAIIKKHLGVMCAPTFCTRTASKLVRTYTDRHGLLNVCNELLGVQLNKQQQSSDWGADELTQDQIQYAANDVLYLHKLMDVLQTMIDREGRSALAQRCFDFLPLRADLDLAGWANIDIFEH